MTSALGEKCRGLRKANKIDWSTVSLLLAPLCIERESCAWNAFTIYFYFMLNCCTVLISVDLSLVRCMCLQCDALLFSLPYRFGAEYELLLLTLNEHNADESK